MSKRKRKENPDSKTTYLKEIDELNKEISHLENELEIRERHSAGSFSDECLVRVVAQLRGLATSARNSRKRSNEEQELNSLLSRVEKLESLTGLAFDEDKVELISSADDNNNNEKNTKKWRRILSGKCFSLPFLIELETEEVLEEEQTAVKKGSYIITVNEKKYVRLICLSA
jgi:hypothetical protein